MIAWRCTQVVKGEVCKTSIHRFKSGRRLFERNGIHFVTQVLDKIMD